MNGMQRWMASHRLDPCRHGSHGVRVSVACTAALIPWRRKGFLTQGGPMRVILCWKVVTTDASLSGWVCVFEGRAVNGTWDAHMRSFHLNDLELFAVHLLAFLRGHHVLVWMDKTIVVAYISRQRSLRSLQLHTLAHRLIVWSKRELCDLGEHSVSSISTPFMIRMYL